MYTFSERGLKCEYSPDLCEFRVDLDGGSWSWAESGYIKFASGERLNFCGLPCESSEFSNGIVIGVKAKYLLRDGLAVHTLAGISVSDGVLLFESFLENEQDLSISSVCFPPAFAFGADKGNGYTVLSRMQGTIIPARYNEEYVFENQTIYERSAYMPVFGQVRDGSGYTAIFETPWDSCYTLIHRSGGDTLVSPLHMPEMENMAYKRVMRYAFGRDMDYNRMAKIYRNYLKEHGKLTTLRQKIDKNPSVKNLIGTPVVHEGISVHIHETSRYYTPDRPELNDHYETFDSLGERLCMLHSKGIKKAYLHVDGWGKHGYDNLHPDPFPPSAEAGGTDGMRRLSETCRRLGYIFGIHDQYRDYYYDAPSFSFENSIMNSDGSHPYCDIWYGGPHSYLCQMLAPDFVRRNYNTFDSLGIKIEGSYLDVFSVVYADRCFSPEHRMTRRDSISKRNECLEILNNREIIPSSEEAVDAYMDSIALCHHAPYFTVPLGDETESRSVGINIPLLNLVWHDCIVIPWSGADSRKKGGWGIPGDQWNFLNALLNGGTVYVSPEADREGIERVRLAADLHSRIALQEMVSHEFLSDDYKRQKTSFSDGTCVEVDFGNDTWEVYRSDK